MPSLLCAYRFLTGAALIVIIIAAVPTTDDDSIGILKPKILLLDFLLLSFFLDLGPGSSQ